MNEQDKAEQQIKELTEETEKLTNKKTELIDKQIIKELKEQGYKSIYERDRDRQYKQASQDYERYLNCPNE